MFTTPNGVDNYSRVFVEGFRETDIIGVPTAFQAFFGRAETGAKTIFSPNANAVDIDIMRGNEKIAALIPRGGISKITSGKKDVNGEKFSSFSRAYPLIEEEGSIDANEINNRVFGEAPYMNMDKTARMRSLAFETHKEHMRRTIRTCEYLAAQSVLTGKMPAILGTTDANKMYDFKRNSSLIYQVNTLWTANSGVDIMGDIDDACLTMREIGHVHPDMAIFGDEAMSLLINDATIQKIANKLLYELIYIGENNPVPAKFNRFVEAGLTPRGRLTTPAGHTLWIFCYHDVYNDASGTAIKYMPTNKVLLSYSGARADRYFGPSELLPMSSVKQALYQEYFGFNPLTPPTPANIKDASNAVNFGMFYLDAYLSPGEKSITLRSQSAPIFATTMTDMFLTLTVAAS